MADEKRIEDELSYPILLSERVRSSAEEAHSFKLECSEIAKQADRLSQMLRTVARMATSPAPLYERPVRRVVADAFKNLEKALTLVRKCKRQSVLRRVVSITGTADFRKISNLLDASVGDMRWLLSVLDSNGTSGGGIVVSLPPIASNDPILSWVWSFVATVQMGQLQDRIEAANELASLAADNDRNKKIIVEEGGLGPLLKLLKEEASPEAQIAAVAVLCNLADDEERVRLMINELAVPTVVQVLRDSPMRVQILTSNLVAKMAEHDPIAKEDFARENAIRPLVTLLTLDTFEEDPKNQNQNQNQNHLVSGKQSIHSLVQINKEMEKYSLIRTNNRPYASSYSSLYSESSSSRAGHNRKERENEKPEVKLKLKTSCAEALWMLARGSVSNSRRITETKGLLCLAKIVEKEQGELQFNCLMAISEITAAAESNADLRRAAFKTNSLAAKAVVEQLLRVINDLETPSLQVAAIKSIGSLARTFPARETRVIGPLVTQLSSRSQDVATEAAIALGKFAGPENFLYAEHSKAIIEFNAVPPLMRLLRGSEQAQLHALVLLCYLALHAGNSKVLEQARLLTVLEGADWAPVSQHPDMRELVSRAIYTLNLYHTGLHPQQI